MLMRRTSRRGLGDTAAPSLTLDQWKAALSAVQCPSGYDTSAALASANSGGVVNFSTAPVPSDVCLNSIGYRQDQVASVASNAATSQKGLIAWAATIGILVFAPGEAKILALGTAYIAWQNPIFAGGM
jgi:hypothetical protein